MEKRIAKIIVSLVLGVLLSFLITWIGSLTGWSAWIVVILLFIPIYTLSGKLIRSSMSGPIGMVGSIVCAAVAALLLACINAWSGGLVIVRILHIVACSVLIYVADGKIIKK